MSWNGKVWLRAHALAMGGECAKAWQRGVQKFVFGLSVTHLPYDHAHEAVTSYNYFISIHRASIKPFYIVRLQVHTRSVDKTPRALRSLVRLAIFSLSPAPP